jgi:hypothetical protein
MPSTKKENDHVLIKERHNPNDDGLIRFWKIRKARHLGALARELAGAFIIGVSSGTALGLAAIVTTFARF